MSNETWQSICNYGQYIAGVLTALLAIGNIYFGNLVTLQNDREKATNGQLTTGKKMSSEDWVTVVVGGVSMTNSKKAFTDGVDVSTLISADGIEPVKLRVRDDKIYVSTTIIGLDKKIVAEIEDNEWSVNPNNYYKRNYDDNSVEVIDQYGHVVLYVELVNPNLVKVNGVFITPSFIFIASPEMLTTMGGYPDKASLGVQAQWQQVYEMRVKSIPKSFRHTGSDYLGKRIRPKLDE
ncbi:hypothetical protein [Fibrivirga algicola]|uniref:Uncharacterized protein n=1 Tax=Fibrivirga algicola TaxID=2950420 RepID=A0ABX0QAR1_9BACT|nr:hypothetical protein [Fibrivirga algicola]NID09356.1 hypothetical protein [Fibrivirga algicola]